MGDDPTLYQTCLASSNDTLAILECVSTAQDEERASLAKGLDSFFLIFAGAMVFFMQTGFAMLCAGSIRAKNVRNVILWNLLDSCGGGLAFWAVGYAFAYGGDLDGGGNTFVGGSLFSEPKGFFMQNDDIRFENWFFQFAFACALSSIVAGTVAERMQMKAYLMYSLFLSGFVYPVVAHSIWSTKGFLSAFSADKFMDSGVVDLAGSGPVHMCGGCVALVAAIILGPRMGRFHDKDGNVLDEPKDFPPHSVTLQFLGTFCLWFGWYGFNPGSVLNISSGSRGEVAALVAVNTTLAACAGAASAMFMSTFIDYWRHGYHTYDVVYTMNGCLTGLAAITSPCASVDTWAAVLIGIGAGIVYTLGSKLMIKLRIDDAVDAIPVHLGGGAWGVISAGLFSRQDLLDKAYSLTEHEGLFYNFSDWTLILVQFVAVVFIFTWSSAIMGIYFYALNMMGWLRVDPLEEEVGLDISRHKGAAYDIKEANREDVKQLNENRQSMVEDRSGRGSKPTFTIEENAKNIQAEVEMEKEMEA